MELAEKMATGNPEVLAELEAQKKVRNANRRQKHAKKRKTVDLSQTAIVPLITSVPYKKQRAMTTRKPKAVQSRERIINDEAHEYLSALASSLAKN